MFEKLKKEFKMFLTDNRLDRAMSYGELEKALKYAAETNYDNFNFQSENKEIVQNGHFVFMFLQEPNSTRKTLRVYIIKNLNDENNIKEDNALCACVSIYSKFEAKAFLMYPHEGKIKKTVMKIFTNVLNYYKENYPKDKRRRIQEFEELI